MEHHVKLYFSIAFTNNENLHLLAPNYHRYQDFEIIVQIYSGERNTWTWRKLPVLSRSKCLIVVNCEAFVCWSICVIVIGVLEFFDETMRLVIKILDLEGVEQVHHATCNILSFSLFNYSLILINKINILIKL